MSKKKDGHPNKLWCNAPEPYPEPKVIGQNLYYANLLLEDYAGLVSEITAINQYLYHHFTFYNYEDLAELQECVAIGEMTHMELLAETILLLGGDPQFRTLTNNNPTYWSGTYVYYGTEICDKLAANIGAELQAIQQYRLHQSLIADPHIQKLIDRIIMDEEKHLTLFREAVKKYCPKP